MCNLSEGIYEEGYRIGYKIGFKEGFKEGLKDGREQAKRERAINLANAVFSPETISRMLKVEVNLVKEWIHN